MSTDNSKSECTILHLLIDGQEMYGLEMLRKASTLKKHKLYTILERMEGRRLIESRPVVTGEVYHRQPRRLYKITVTGKQYLMERA